MVLKRAWEILSKSRHRLSACRCAIDSNDCPNLSSGCDRYDETMGPVRIALVGLGKIARDQHVPVLAQNRSFELIAVASPRARFDGLRSYPDLDALLNDMPDVDAVAVCTPPQVRHAIAHRALEHGCHVLLEKPP